jgi:hypothetical protein
MEENAPGDTVGDMRSPDIDIPRWGGAGASQGEFEPDEPYRREGALNQAEPQPHTLAWLLAPAPEVVAWWEREEHMESVIADLAQADPSVAAFVAAVRPSGDSERAAASDLGRSPAPSSGLAAQRLAYRRSIGTVPATNLAATKDVRGVTAHSWPNGHQVYQLQGHVLD